MFTCLYTVNDVVNCICISFSHFLIKFFISSNLFHATIISLFVNFSFEIKFLSKNESMKN